MHVCMCVHALAAGPWNTEVACGVQGEIAEYRGGRKAGSDSSAWGLRGVEAHGVGRQRGPRRL